MARNERSAKHEFTGLPGFDAAVRKIVGTAKAEVDRREAAARKARKRKKG